ncbi:hypothetical protein PISMIDRAFT_463994 [Pisolithus microcarpus 441]|uniref:Uncharacterized protein n=1 Tax=Pisolithus microcarpus 441 TaxID=765257 RepID=A0A0C9Y549_9AGAM|nr:hypothetical protein PISMIDRAFT_463994 [Pisolithus microcarpus 441]
MLNQSLAVVAGSGDIGQLGALHLMKHIQRHCRLVPTIDDAVTLECFPLPHLAGAYILKSPSRGRQEKQGCKLPRSHANGPEERPSNRAEATLIPGVASEPKATTGPPACTGRVLTPSTIWFPDASPVSLLSLRTRCGVRLERLQEEESWGLGGVTEVCGQPAAVVYRSKHAPG